jgi:hypothetical protein
MMRENPRERPILFSGPMVHALLDGRKTVTRRIVREREGCRIDVTRDGVPVYVTGAPDDGGEPIPCPSRITLELTDVRAERLHDITEEDARAEGVTPFRKDPEGDCWSDGTHRTAFEFLWNEIHGWSPNAWEQNPWVWRLAFRRIEKEINHGR